MTSARPARNRVTPRGEIIAVAGRGVWLGNRGRLHEGGGARDIVRSHRPQCTLDSTNRLRISGSSTFGFP